MRKKIKIEKCDLCGKITKTSRMKITTYSYFSYGGR